LCSSAQALAPDEPTHAEVDDLLYRHGLIEPQALPETYSTAALREPVSRFAEVLRRVMAEESCVTMASNAALAALIVLRA
jgi:hypothetical protein